MINGVEMLYDYIESTDEYTYSYIKDYEEHLVYCPHCKKFEKMDVLAYFNISNNRNANFYFENHVNDEEFLGNHGDVIYKEGVRFYSHDRYMKSYRHNRYSYGYNYDFKPKMSARARRRKPKRQLYRNIKSFICPECHTIIPRHKVLYFESRQPSPAQFCNGVQIFRETGKNGTYIKATLLFIEYGVWNNQLITRRLRKKKTFNVNTGHTYSIRDLYISGSKKNAKGPAIKNVTYNDNYETQSFFEVRRGFTKQAVRALYEAVYKEKVALLGHKPDGYPEVMPDEINRSASASLIYVSGLNRFPNIPHNVYASIIKVKTDEYASVMNKDMYKVKMNADDWVTEALKAHKMKPTKFLKRLVRSGAHPHVLKAITAYIKEPNNVTKLVNSGMHFREEHFKSDFMRDTLKLCGETAAVNKICATPYMSYLVDTITMYNVAKRVLGHYDITGTVREIHDNLSKDYHKLSRENITLEYDKKVMKLQRITDEYDLVFAKDTHELIDVGTYMRICVGSYGNRAVEKQCNIMLLKDKTGNPLVCIELSGDYKRIIQAKFYGNDRLPQKEFDFVTQWVKDNKFVISTTDLESPKKPKVRKNNNIPVPVEVVAVAVPQVVAN